MLMLSQEVCNNLDITVIILLRGTAFITMYVQYFEGQNQYFGTFEKMPAEDLTEQCKKIVDGLLNTHMLVFASDTNIQVTDYLPKKCPHAKAKKALFGEEMHRVKFT